MLSTQSFTTDLATNPCWKETEEILEEFYQSIQWRLSCAQELWGWEGEVYEPNLPPALLAQLNLEYLCWKNEMTHYIRTPTFAKTMNEKIEWANRIAPENDREEFERIVIREQNIFLYTKWYKAYEAFQSWEPLRTIRRTRKFKEALLASKNN